MKSREDTTPVTHKNSSSEFRRPGRIRFMISSKLMSLKGRSRLKPDTPLLLLLLRPTSASWAWTDSASGKSCLRGRVEVDRSTEDTEAPSAGRSEARAAGTGAMPAAEDLTAGRAGGAAVSSSPVTALNAVSAAPSVCRRRVRGACRLPSTVKRPSRRSSRS